MAPPAARSTCRVGKAKIPLPARGSVHWATRFAAEPPRGGGPDRSSELPVDEEDQYQDDHHSDRGERHAAQLGQPRRQTVAHSRRGWQRRSTTARAPAGRPRAAPAPRPQRRIGTGGNPPGIVPFPGAVRGRQPKRDEQGDLHARQGPHTSRRAGRVGNAARCHAATETELSASRRVASTVNRCRSCRAPPSPDRGRAARRAARGAPSTGGRWCR